MKLTKISSARYRLSENKIIIEGSLDIIKDRMLTQGLLDEFELDDALADLSARGNNVAHFGLNLNDAFAGEKTYSFMYSMFSVKEAA